MPRRGYQPWFDWAVKPRHISPVARALAGVDLKDIQRLHETGRSPSSDLNTKLHKAYIAEQFGRLRRGGFHTKEARVMARKDPTTVKQAISDRRAHATEMVFKYKAPLLKSKSSWYREINKMLAHMAKKHYEASEWAAFSDFYAKHGMAKRGTYFVHARKQVQPPPPEPQLTDRQVEALTLYQLKQRYRKRHGLPPLKKPFKMPEPEVPIVRKDIPRKKVGRAFPAYTKPQAPLPKGKMPRVLSLRAKAALKEGRRAVPSVQPHVGRKQVAPVKVGRSAVKPVVHIHRKAPARRSVKHVGTAHVPRRTRDTKTPAKKTARAPGQRRTVQTGKKAPVKKKR